MARLGLPREREEKDVEAMGTTSKGDMEVEEQEMTDKKNPSSIDVSCDGSGHGHRRSGEVFDGDALREL